MLPNNRPLIIGITGNIGSGKTTVCKIIGKRYPVFYADKIAHQVLNEPVIIDILTEHWGQQIIKDNTIDRKAVAQKVFGNTEELNFLNSVVHPKVLESMQQITDKSNERFLFFEVPLLFEANLQPCFDHIVLIKTSYANRLNRVSLRDNQLNAETILINKAQMDDNDKSAISDAIIDNNASIQDLSISVEAFLAKLPQLLKRDIKPFYNLN
jgi:dephospho-CoA kinase